MRKLAAIILSFVMILTLSACNAEKIANASETSAESEAGSTLGNIMNYLFYIAN